MLQIAKVNSCLSRSLLASLFAAICTAVGCSESPESESPKTTEPEASAGSEAHGKVESATAFVRPQLTDEELQEGWISLFDGVSLFGWDIPGNTGWRVEDGQIVCDSGGKSLLLTPFRFDDFEFRCDFLMAAGGNSGVFLRTAEQVADPATDTYELNICDGHPSHKTGSLVGRFVAENVSGVEGSWHTFRVHCEGQRIQVWLDGNQIVDFTDTSEGMRLSGRIGLQMNEGRIAFRNVFLKPLSTKSLFNGTDLTGWNVVPGSKSEFEVTDGRLRVRKGPGFLETADTLKDFVLQAEIKTNGDSLNSGIFFRAMPGTADAPSNGYEMQIHNGFKDGDRSNPEDSGSGAIFRRVPARYVVADDHQWFTQTLIAQGDRFATWVNGYQVVNWQDTRPVDDNPRKGKRTDGGHVSLQGHDPGTDVEFRAIRIRELPE